MTRILVVEDEPDIMETTAELLRLHGFEVDTVAEIRGVVALLASNPPDLLLQDCHMPALDLARHIKAIRAAPGLQRLPIILFTASIEAAGFWKNVGADGLVRKPFDISSLVALVRQKTQAVVH